VGGVTEGLAVGCLTGIGAVCLRLETVSCEEGGCDDVRSSSVVLGRDEQCTRGEGGALAIGFWGRLASQGELCGCHG